VMRRWGWLWGLAGTVGGCHDVDRFEPCPEGSVTVNGSCTPTPSCSGLAENCGPQQDESCCATAPVPGGTFVRGFDEGQNSGSVPNFLSNPTSSDSVTVGPFSLDRYEISIGRFRAFLGAMDMGWFASSLQRGDGADPNRPTYTESDGGTVTTGWSTAITTCADGGVPRGCVQTTGQDIMADIANRCSAPNGQLSVGDWTPMPGPNEDKPMPCITWYESMMFCIYDQGRLPTEAEWNFAAAGGSQQRAYPWSNPPTELTIDSTLATYGSLESADDVGSHPAGMGPFGQYDLAGNVWEWVLDSPTKASDGTLLYAGDSLNPVDFSGDAGRVLRGGSFEDSAPDLRTSARVILSPTARYRDSGARCARP